MLPRILLVILAFLCSTAVAGAEDAQPKYLWMGTPVDWNINDLGGSYSYSDQQDRTWTASLTTEGQVEGKPKFLKLTVSGPNVKPVSIDLDVELTAESGTLAVYDFDKEYPAFIVTNYSMGAHCCIVAKAVAFDGQALAGVDVGEFDGDAITVRDIDGDGTYEIETYDQRFLYAFDSYAASLPARKLLKISGGKVEDVTTGPYYSNYLIGEINKRIGDCLKEPTAGVCAGVLGTAAKAGLYQSVAAEIPFKQISAQMDATYLDCSPDECETQITFASFREALEYRLTKWGYETQSSMTGRVRDYFRQLSAFPKGFGSPDKDSEMACGRGPVKIAMNKSEQYVEVEGYEYVCNVEKANILDKSAVALGLCRGEGEHYSTLLMFEYDKGRLLMSSIHNGGVNSDPEPMDLTACR
jgi:hypothetical protein